MKDGIKLQLKILLFVKLCRDKNQVTVWKSSKIHKEAQKKKIYRQDYNKDYIYEDYTNKVIKQLNSFNLKTKIL